MYQSCDSLGNQIAVDPYATRIISLVPSLTELLFDLGLDQEVVGITKFCIHPDSWFRTKNRVGGTKNVNIEKIAQLNPDLIIANKEENDKDNISYLLQNYPTWVSDIKTMDHIQVLIREISKLCNRVQQGNVLWHKISSQFKKLSETIAQHQLVPVCYLIWQKPYMTIGGDTFINHLLELSGFQNCWSNSQRYPILSEKDIQASHAEYIFLSSEPFPFAKAHQILYANLFPDKKIILVDGTYFSWYGSRLVHAVDYFLQLRKDIL